MRIQGLGSIKPYVLQIYLMLWEACDSLRCDTLHGLLVVLGNLSVKIGANSIVLSFHAQVMPRMLGLTSPNKATRKDSKTLHLN